jgi:hypothetical protein
MSINILDKIKDYNNKKNSEINNKLKIKDNYTIDFDKNNNENIIIYKEDNKILVGNFVFCGVYQKDTKLWIWADSISGINKRHLKIITKIKNNSYLFENNDNPTALFIYQLLTNNILYITDIKFLNIINNVLNYLLNGILIINPVNSNDNTQIICLTKIIEKYY